jgi:hypothetical protein
MTKPLITVETEIGKKKTRGPKEIPYDELKASALSLPINIRAALAKELKQSVIDENDKIQVEAKELQSLTESLK